MSDKFQKAKARIASIISRSLKEEDPMHSENTLAWLLRMKPDADEVLQLAAFGHDIERGLSDRFKNNQFKTYDEYKSAHAERAGGMLSDILKEAGYNNEEAQRIQRLVSEAEFASNDKEIQLISDADSISYFDNNIYFYLKRSGEEKTKEKMRFMYSRASDVAKKYIHEIAGRNSVISKLLNKALNT